MSAAVRPIHLPTAAVLDSLRHTVRDTLEAWAREWVRGLPDGAPHAAAVRISCASEDAGPASHPYEEMRTQSGRIWFRRGAADRASLGHAVVGAESMPGVVGADDWIAEIVESAWHSRNRALCSRLIGTPDAEALAVESELPARLFAFGSGAIRISCDALSLQAIAESPSWLRSPPAQRTPARRLPTLTPLDRAAHRSSAQLEVTLGSVEIELPKVADLRRGDVLCLPLRLDHSLPVLCEGKPLARGVLGESQGHRCVRVTARDE